MNVDASYHHGGVTITNLDVIIGGGHYHTKSLSIGWKWMT